MMMMQVDGLMFLTPAPDSYLSANRQDRVHTFFAAEVCVPGHVLHLSFVVLPSPLKDNRAEYMQRIFDSWEYYFLLYGK